MTSIRRQLTRGLFGGLSILILLSGFVFYLVLRESLVGEFDSTNAAVAEALMGNIEQHGDGQVEFDPPPELLSRFEGTVEYFEIWVGRHLIPARSPSLGGADLERRSGPVSQPAIWNLQLPDGRSGRAWGVRFEPPLEIDEDAPTMEGTPPSTASVVLVYARGRESLDRLLRMLALAFASYGLLLPLAAAWLVRGVIRRSLSPLERISEEILAVRPGTLNHRFAEDTVPEELLATTRRLNELLARLQQAFERERRFSSNAAHELRTPIAELRTLAEVALRDPTTGGKVRPVFEDALAIALQMERIVSVLRTLSGVEGGQARLELRHLDLAATVKKAWDSLRARADEKDLSCHFDLASAAEVESDAALLGAVLSNLLENAVLHSPRGGRVTCRLEKHEGGQYRLTISNSSAGLTPEDLERVFEPFWQKDPAHSDPNHSGLGLAATATFAQLLQIELTAKLPSADTFEMQLAIRSTFPSPHQGVAVQTPTGGK